MWINKLPYLTLPYLTLPGDTRRTTSELPCRAPATYFSRQNRSLETQNGSCFSLFDKWYDFWNCKSLFVDIWCHLQWENCLPDLLTNTLEFFPPAECWLVNSNFPRASRMQGSSLNSVVSQDGGYFSPIFGILTGHRKSRIWPIQNIFALKYSKTYAYFV